MFDASAYGASGIAEEYDALYVDEWDTGGAVERLAELAGPGPVLEFGVGTGRLALPLLARGIEVHGVEGSAEMAQKLREKPDGDRVHLTMGDFSSANAGSDFSLVILAFNTIFALPDQQAQVDCFANAARHLAPGGAFVVEAWIPDIGAFRHNKALRQRIMGETVVLIESAVLDPVAQMMKTTQVVLSEGSVRLYPANHRYAWPGELDLMARLAGMDRESRWNDWSGAPFGPESRTHVSIYRLPPT